MAATSIAAQIQQDADFFDSMVHLIPQSYYAPQQQDTDSKFTHSKGTKAAGARQAMKESSKQGQKAKAKFDLANYTNVLSNGKRARDASDDDDDEDEDDEDEDEDMDEDEDEDEESEDEQPASKRKPAAAAAAGKKSSAAAAAASPSLSATPAPAVAASASSSSSLPAPPLSSLSADVGMDQLRQRLHARISGLSNRRKPLDHPFAKKRQKVDAAEKKKRAKNEERPSVHRGNGVPASKHARDEADANGGASPAKRAKLSSGAAAPASSGASSSAAAAATSASLRASDISDTGDFQFAALKPVEMPGAKAGSFSLQGKQQRKKNKSDGELLKSVEAFDAKLASLKAAGAGGAEEAQRMERERALDNALLRAQGVRVKDDAKLLRKSLKRDEKKKEKSRAAWSERTAAQKSTQDAFHKERIERAGKKGQHDRSKFGTTKADHADEGKSGRRGGGAGGEKKPGRAGFEGKKKFLN